MNTAGNEFSKAQEIDMAREEMVDEFGDQLYEQLVEEDFDRVKNTIRSFCEMDVIELILNQGLLGDFVKAAESRYREILVRNARLDKEDPDR